MSKPPESGFERILVALEISPPGREALREAADLAAHFDAELAGYFIEDVNLLRAAALSFTREMGLASGTSRQLDLTDIERSLRVQAKAAETSIARVANDLQLRWSFATMRGPGAITMLTTTHDVSLLVLAARATAFRGENEPARARKEHASAASERPVTVIFDGSPHARRAVRVAAVIAHRRGAPLTVLVRAGDERGAEVLRTQLRDLAAPDPRDVRYARLEKDSGAETAAAARALRAALLVIPGGASGLSARQLSFLLERLHCPLVLVTVSRVDDAPAPGLATHSKQGQT